LFQPSNVHEVTVTVAAKPRVRADGAIERVEPAIEEVAAFEPAAEFARKYGELHATPGAVQTD